MFTNKKTFNSYFTNKFNIVFNCEIHNTVDQKQELFKYSILKKLDNNRIDESIFIQNEEKIVEYNSINRGKWINKENNTQENYYTFYFKNVICNSDMIYNYKYLVKFL